MGLVFGLKIFLMFFKLGCCNKLVYGWVWVDVGCVFWLG